MALLGALRDATGGSLDSRAEAIFDDLLSAERGEVVVAEEDGQVLGMYGLYLVESTEHNLPFYQKYGFSRVGSELRQRLG